MLRQLFISALFSMLMLSNLTVKAQSEIRSAYQRQKQAMKAYNKAYTAFDAQDIAEADSLISGAILLSPKYPEAYYLRAMIREAQDNPFAALVDYETVIQLDPDNIEARFKKATLHYEMGNFEQALTDAKEVLGYENTYATTTVYYKIGPDGNVTGAATIQRMDADLHNLMGLAYQGLESLEASVEQFDEALTINSEEPQYYNNKARSLLLSGDTSEAITTYHNGLTVAPQDQTLLFNLSRVEEIEPDQYATMFEQGSNPQLLLQRAYEKFQDNDFNGALADYSSVLKSDESTAVTWLDRGRTYARLKQHSKAIQDYRKALELDAELIQSYYLLANSYQSLGKYKQALDLYAYYLTVDSSTPSVYYNYAICLHLAGNDTQACEQVDKALTLGFHQARELKSTFCQNP